MSENELKNYTLFISKGYNYFLLPFRMLFNRIFRPNILHIYLHSCDSASRVTSKTEKAIDKFMLRKRKIK